ncbi:methylated-DNA-[protein]-cysteine S-methyltransferase [Salsuginibacillus halophilus]|uniref:Methylated-DNA--protein-cysteine methyltransferase n=1 Tax=Salsuginibacillus halophilus TaxID=517424 RepID=A0A2P8HG63_9BACI|nr:methylated-DNA--[protein]-cysteine S-methyltransferase [Salsuginibacillus halophilus]PSL45218.1 methylated-DNA-[protein]-cysteine S-methyltransferase [Salsuginibacillus halophilus]
MSDKRSVSYGELSTPIGPVTVFRTEQGIFNLQLAGEEPACKNVQAWMKKHQCNRGLIQDEAGLSDAFAQIEEYFSGQREEFDLALDLRGSQFQRLVWKALETIPYGELSTYKRIAAQIGSPKAVRAIGNANNQNPVPLILPCHRVVGSNGAMVGYVGGVEKKRSLLAHEGALETAALS